ncbi:UvrABC system protein C [uncultured Desulfobacterium sp.]|uniref:UvrABC system protein C n=1 Tax=uncultured Desulfobacterium sp. TaxID=201089 RepID=A0A445N0V1_9BACT|nr:UvrABC system protein C [uncultured Desulfobacterium sp.]
MYLLDWGNQYHLLFYCATKLDFMDQSPHLKYELEPERLRQVLPDSPGVYCFRDSADKVIYVGKAKDLKKRVLSYFRPDEYLADKTILMMKRANSLDFIITSTEQEAFILESSLIKRHLPRYNVILRDDKQYPCLKLDINEPYPRLRIVRRIKKDGAVYFGPFPSAGALRSTHNIIDRVFKLRKCLDQGLPRRTRPCLNFQMGRCLGPCTNDVPVEKYQEIVRQVRLFLDGRNTELISQLNSEMKEASESLDFERAAGIRDQIRDIEKTVERQHVVSSKLEDKDVIGLSQRSDQYQVAGLFVRKGYVVGSRNYYLRNQGGSPSEVMESFLKQYYSNGPLIPGQILISEPIEDLDAISNWLCGLAGKKVVIHRPHRGEGLRLLQMAIANAERLLAGRMESGDETLLSQVQQWLKLSRPPRSIEGLDISNIHGDEAVGAVVSFVDGLPYRQGYRNYRIRAIEGIDDYGMMTELVQRRMGKGEPPDLFLVDGGRGHLSCVKAVLDRLGDEAGPDVVSIAKPDEGRGEKYDKIYLPDRKNPLALSSDHPVLLLLMRIRDEAHRRAVSYHRKLRSKGRAASELDQIPGIGPKKRNALLKRFGSIAEVEKAGIDKLKEVPGISQSLAEAVLSYFKKPG